MDRAQIDLIVQQLLGIAAIASPGHAATVAVLRGLLAAGGTLHDLIRQIRAEDPAAWAAVSADFNASHTALLAAIDKE